MPCLASRSPPCPGRPIPSVPAMPVQSRPRRAIPRLCGPGHACRSLPNHTGRILTPPGHSLPIQTMPAMPRHTWPYQSAPRLASPIPACRAGPHHAEPNLSCAGLARPAVPRPTAPLQDSPSPALPCLRPSCTKRLLSRSPCRAPGRPRAAARATYSDAASCGPRRVRDAEASRRARHLRARRPLTGSPSLPRSGC